jgi:diguanylate cyclase (GGDEF)-like protein
MGSTTVSATLGVTSLALGGFADWQDYSSIWLTWWLGDAVGDILLAPLLLLCFVGPRPRWDRSKLFEVVVLGLSLVLAGGLVFGGLLAPDIKNYPLEFLCIPFLIWIAFRFDELEAAAGVLLVSGIAVWGTLHGYGPFVTESRNESLLLLQAFMGVMGVMTICVAVVVAQLRTAREELEREVVTDPVTGLANYRRFENVFSAEVERSRRNGRPFALLLLDLDGLKKINDTHGHSIGSQALRRVAIVLQFHSRAVDTAARYGGDEFAVLLPETGAERAWRVAERIAERVADDGEEPRLSISFGISVYPQDGETIGEIFRTADAALYAMKRAGGSRVSS